MSAQRCTECGSELVLPEGYNQPFFKCSGCGSNQKLNLPENDEPKYKILDKEARQRGKAQTQASSNPPPNPPPENEAPVFVERRRAVSAPILASAERRAAVAPKKAHDFGTVAKPISEKRILEDSLGKPGLEMVLQAVAGYMGELNEKKRQVARIHAIQKLMRSKIPAELASRAVAFAEKSAEVEDILWADYRSAFIHGLVIFGVGVAISLLVHFIAKPGSGFVVFQIPFAVGFAYSINAAINMAGLKFPIFRSEKIHYGFMIFSVIFIALYVIAGIWF